MTTSLCGGSLLLLLPDDCCLGVFAHVAGPPPVQAIVLARVAMSCWRLKALAEVAAAELVAARMQLARAEEAALPEAFRRHLTLEPVHPSGALLTLWGRVPRLPLQFDVLCNSALNSDGGTVIEAARACGLACCHVQDGTRLTWHTHHGQDAEANGAAEAAAEAEHVRTFAIGARSQDALRLAEAIGLATHPGLLARSCSRARSAAPCPSCHKWRRYDHAEHQAWLPDAIDRVLLPLPPAALERIEAERRAAVRPRSSGRDAEVFDEYEMAAMTEESERIEALKCTCDVLGSSVCKYIGAPPGAVLSRVSS